MTASKVNLGVSQEILDYYISHTKKQTAQYNRDLFDGHKIDLDQFKRNHNFILTL